MPESPAQGLGLGSGEGPGDTEQLEPAHHVGGVTDGGEPGPVGVEVAEGEPAQPGVLQAADVVFDVGVGAHGGIEGDRVAGLVGPVAPVAELGGGEQGVLGAGVEGFTAHDQPAAFGQVVVVDQVGELGHLGAGASDDADVAHLAGPTYESYEVANPEPGEWTVSLYGADIDAGGEPVELEVTPIGADGAPIDIAPNAPPEAVVTAGPRVGPPPLNVAFDASSSTDRDGSIARYSWDFGDGTTGTGPTASHLYGSPGTYIATLRVVDDDGTTDISAPIPIIAGTVEPPVNQAPDAVDDAFTVPGDQPFSVAAPGVLANDSDPDDDSLSATIVTAPAHGTVTLAADGSFEYVPEQGFEGVDSFTYRASDGVFESTEATVSLTVVADAAPTAAADAYVTDEDTPLVLPAEGVLGNDGDADGDALSATLVSGAGHGEAELAADGSFTYTPNADFSGTDSFSYKASDGFVDSGAATVTITVVPVNDAPAAAASEVTTTEDTPLTIEAPGVLGNDTDVDGDELSAVLVSGPEHGALELAPDGGFTYTPNPDFHGPDTFSYKANDGSVDSPPANVSIAVTSVNDAPVVAADAYTAQPDQELIVGTPGVLTNDVDPDGDQLQAVLVSNPAHGGVELAADGSFTYLPQPGFHGTDSFSYQASDGTTSLTTVVATIEVAEGPNRPPAAADDEVTTAEDTPVSADAPGLLANDGDDDGDALTAVLLSDPAHGALQLAPDGSFTYVPEAGFHGADAFVYRANDGELDSAPATVNITVTPVDDVPIATSDQAMGTEDVPIHVPAPGVLANDGDVDGDALTAAVVSGPAHGHVDLATDGSFTYTPNANFHGTDSFTYTATGGGANSSPATVALTITPVNDVPLAIGETYGGQQGKQIVVLAPGVLANDGDIDGDALTAAVVSGPAHGHVDLAADGSFTYTPNANFHGVDTFTYRANDGTVDSPVATVTLNVQAQDTGPALSVADAAPVSEPKGRSEVFAEFKVTLSAPARRAVQVHVATVDGTAVAGKDFRSVSQDLRFSPGETRKTVKVRILADSVTEPQEQLTLQLSNPSGATIADASAIGTIRAG